MAFNQTCVDTGKSFIYSVQRSSCTDCGKVAGSHFYTDPRFVCPSCAETNYGIDYDMGQGILALFGFGKKAAVCIKEAIPRDVLDELEASEKHDRILPLSSSSVVVKDKQSLEAHFEKGERKSRKKKRSQSADARRSGSKGGVVQFDGPVTQSRNLRNRSKSPSSRRVRMTSKDLSACKPSVSDQRDKKIQPPSPKRRPPVSPVYSSKRYLIEYKPEVPLEIPEEPETPKYSAATSKEISRRNSEMPYETSFLAACPDMTKKIEVRSMSCPPEYLIGGAYTPGISMPGLSK